MASDEHKKLAGFIKATHNQLRKDSRIYGATAAWEKHLARTEVLQNYATAMQELATEHWNNEYLEKDSGAHCRNKWIRSQCYEYFFNGGKEKFDKRENDIRSKILALANNVDTTGETVVESLVDDCVTREKKSKIKLLDVGSCYNPLGEEEMFEVTPIDLAPYSDKVLQCDFLNVRLGSETVISEDGKVLEQLKETSFDVVVFSLLLEYFPCPLQRFICCQKAYKLLKAGGLLLIITPDSSHVGANAKIMKSWRLVMSRMGCMRIVYEKSRHLHCLGFRKCVEKNVAIRWAEMQVIPETDALLRSDNRIYIPQDFQAVAAEVSCENVVYSADELLSAFEEMPCAHDTFE